MARSIARAGGMTGRTGGPSKYGTQPWNRSEELIDDIGCGLVGDPLDPADLAAAIGWILEHPAEAEEMGRRGSAAVATTYNWSHESMKLVNLYRTLTR